LLFRTGEGRKKGEIDVSGFKGLLTHDILQEVYLKEDVDLVKKTIASCEERNEELRAARKCAGVHCKNVYKAVRPAAQWKEPKKVGSGGGGAAASSGGRSKPGKVWYATIKPRDDAREIIRKLGPVHANISIVRRRGLYAVTCDGMWEQGFSWTQVRNPTIALHDAIVRAWEAAKRWHNEECPQHILAAIDNLIIDNDDRT
jgi:hypothetical protein